MSFVGLLLALAPVLQDSPAEADEVARWLATLDRAEEPGWSTALDALTALGTPAAERALQDFTSLDFLTRRARAKLLLTLAAPELAAPVLERLGDPDPQVRRLFVLFLGDPALGESEAEARVTAFERLALTDPSEYVRQKAREALAACGLASAVPALDRLVDGLAPAEAERAALALARLPPGRERLIARVTRAFSGQAAPAAGTLAALLGGYGRALAEVPGGGEAPGERRPLLLGRTHSESRVRSAAQQAMAGFVARCVELSEGERADAVLSLLGAEGWPVLEVLRRRIDLAWFQRGDPRLALELARELARRAELTFEEGRGGAEERDGWLVRARLLEVAALVADAREPEAEERLAVLVEELEHSLARRSDLFPSPRPDEWTRGGGAAQIERLHLLALAHEWRALLALGAPEREREALVELARAHELFLQSREVSVRTDAPDPVSLDALFEREVGPHALVLFNERLDPARRAARLDQALMLARAWAGVAPLELLGFEPSELGRTFDPLLDPRRLAALEALREAERLDLVRREQELDDPVFGTTDPDQRRQLVGFFRYRREEIDTAVQEERVELEEARRAGALDLARLRTIFARRLENLQVSMHVERLALELRSEGRAAEARALAERALATMRSAPLGTAAILDEWNASRFEALRGDTFMDENRPREAEQAFLAAVARLETIEQEIESRRGASDPEQRRQIEAQLDMLRGRRAGALLSLAVNANVRMGDQARALAYFERAYVLDQSPSMEVLRACYRARSGRAEEARTVLRKVVPSASLYYNIACTHALMGEKGPALDFLERDFSENYPTAGARARQVEWAKKDPDLASLRGEPRFERLMAGER